VGSTITRESDAVIYTHAGPEIGVASTKTFTTQLILLFLVAVKLGQLRQRLSPQQARSLIEYLHALPVRLEKLLEREEDIAALARAMSSVDHALYLGRGLNYPVALEGALKLKELSYIHAEGCPAGEMKHGPIALVDETLPVIVVNAFDRSDPDGRILYEKTLSNMVEVKARGGRLMALVVETDEAALKDCGDDLGAHLIRVPPTHPWLLPVVAVIPLQLLAYHVAVLRGCDVDQPRNLAKSVTVE
jgi:glucosamine--fructose-6-phosphate aminotransferase (isomerizing)